MPAGHFAGNYYCYVMICASKKSQHFACREKRFHCYLIPAGHFSLQIFKNIQWNILQTKRANCIFLVAMHKPQTGWAFPNIGCWT